MAVSSLGLTQVLHAGSLQGGCPQWPEECNGDLSPLTAERPGCRRRSAQRRAGRLRLPQVIPGRCSAWVELRGKEDWPLAIPRGLGSRLNAGHSWVLTWRGGWVEEGEKLLGEGGILKEVFY